MAGVDPDFPATAHLSPWDRGPATATELDEVGGGSKSPSLHGLLWLSGSREEERPLRPEHNSGIHPLLEQFCHPPFKELTPRLRGQLHEEPAFRTRTEPGPRRPSSSPETRSAVPVLGLGRDPPAGPATFADDFSAPLAERYPPTHTPRGRGEGPPGLGAAAATQGASEGAPRALERDPRIKQGRWASPASAHARPQHQQVGRWEEQEPTQQRAACGRHSSAPLGRRLAIEFIFSCMTGALSKKVGLANS